MTRLRSWKGQLEPWLSARQAEGQTQWLHSGTGRAACHTEFVLFLLGDRSKLWALGSAVPGRPRSPSLLDLAWEHLDQHREMFTVALGMRVEVTGGSVVRTRNWPQLSLLRALVGSYSHTRVEMAYKHYS